MPTYYVSNTGDDALAGTSGGTAWQNLSKVNATSFLAGDTVLFKRGDTWKGTLTVPTSGTVGNLITFGAYGTGVLPIINGWNTISGWVNEGGGIHSKIDSSFQSEMRLVTVNAIVQPKGRFPKTGWLTTNSSSGNTSVTSSALTGTPNFNGGEIVVLKVTWIIDKGTITSHSGGTIGYTGTSNYNAGINWGFFIQNHVNACTELGDWYYDSAAKKIFMFFGAETPSNYIVKVSDTVNLVDCTARNYIRFENLFLEGAHNALVNFRNCNNNNISFCNLEKSGFYGAFLDSVGGNTDNMTLEDNVFRDTFNHAIRGENSRFINIRRNNIQRNFLIAGTSGNGDNHGSAIAVGTFLFRNGNYNIENNTIANVGYNGIYASGSNILIQKNLISQVCRTKEDGAAIYLYGGKEQLTDTYNTNRIVRRNICFNNTENSNPTPYGKRETYSIYFDDRSRNIICDYNSVLNNYGGIYLHNSRDITVHYNKCYNNSWNALHLNDSPVVSDSDGNIQGLDIRFNQFYATGSQRILRINNEVNSIADFGVINNNYYIKPDGGTIIEKLISFGSQVNYSTVAAWNTAFGYDGATLMSPTASTISAIYDNRTLDSVITTIGASRINVDGNAISSLQSIASFESLIVLEGTDPIALNGLTYILNYTIS